MGDRGQLPAYALRSVDNALRIILLIAEREEMSLSAIAEELGLGASTVHRLLGTLRHHGFVRQSVTSRRYRLGHAVSALGAFDAGQDYAAVAREPMRELQRLSGETVHLAVLTGRSVRFVEVVESTSTMRVTSRAGKLLPAHCTSAGKALLAELTTNALRRLYPQEELLPLTAASHTSRTALERELEATRQRGYARNVSESEEHVAGLGMAIHDGEGVAVASLTVAAPLSRFGMRSEPGQRPCRESTVADLLGRTVREIEARLARRVVS